MTNRSNIAVYLKCIWCERDGIEPRMEIGFTSDGNLQLWCAIHDCAIGPPFELKFPPLVGHLTCAVCRDAEKRTHEHDGKSNERASEQIRGHDHGHDHGHNEEG
jgi:hypothetical protein